MKVLSQHVPEGSEENHGNLRIASDPQKFEPGVPCFECDHWVSQFCKINLFQFWYGAILEGTLKADDGTHAVFRDYLNVLTNLVSFRSIGTLTAVGSDATVLYGWIKRKENLKVFVCHRRNCEYHCVLRRDVVWSGRWIDMTTFVRNLLPPYFALKMEVPGFSSHTTLASHLK